MDFRQLLMQQMANPNPVPLPPTSVTPPYFPSWRQQRMPTFASPPMMGPMAQTAYGMAGVPTGSPVQPQQPPGNPQIPTQPGGSGIASPPMVDPIDIIRTVTRGGGRVRGMTPVRPV